MTIATENGTIIVYANVHDAAELNVTEDRPKSIKVTNTYNGKSCWLPKKWLKPSKPNVPTYENEYKLKPWASNILDDQQERVLNLLG